MEPKITYSTTAYVECDRNTREAIVSVMDAWAEGSENVCVTVEDIAALVAKMDMDIGTFLDLQDATDAEKKEFEEVRNFLKAVLKETSGKAGDVVFHK